MAGAKKLSKNNPAGRVHVVNHKMVSSSECEKCTDKCKQGSEYLAKMSDGSGRIGFGIKCIKA